MPLKLSLTKGEKLVVNGAVIKNDGLDANLVFENQAHILRQKDILSSAEANTPASRAYLSLQCAYMFPDNNEVHLRDYNRLVSDFAAAVPSALPIIERLIDRSNASELYHALKICRELIDYENEILSHAAE